MMDKYIFAFCVLSCIMIVFCIIGFAMDFLPKLYIGCAFGALICSVNA